MELTALGVALGAVEPGTKLTVQSDSQYVVRGFNEWRTTWEQNGWRTAKNKPVQNERLWRRIDAVVQEKGLDVTLTDVVGHSDHELNNRADALARNEAQRARTSHRGAHA